MKWKYFGAACVLAGYTLNAMGAPWYSVACGIALAVAWNLRKQTGARSL